MTEETDEFYDVEEDNAGEQAGVACAELADAPYPLHRAAFNGDVLRIKQLMAISTKEQQRELDPHGNNALHVAAWRRMHLSVQALLAGGFPVMAKSSRGWTAMDEALAAKDRELAHMLQRAVISQARLEMKERRLKLLATMREMPDFTMQLKWELGSTVPGLGMLLRRYAPHDLYHIWKVGDRLRVDGSLMGLDTSSSIIPEWKRGHFSLIFDGSNCATSSSDRASHSATATSNGATSTSDAVTGDRQVAKGHTSTSTSIHAAAVSGMQPAASNGASSNSGGSSSNARHSPRLLFLNRKKQHYIDVGADKKKMKETEDAELAAELDAELDDLMDKHVDRVRLKASELRFAPVRGWLGGEHTERVEGWHCKVYEATGKLKSVSTFKAAFELPPGASFDDYLRAHVPDDPKHEQFFDPLFGGPGRPPGSSGSRPAGAAGAADAADTAEDAEAAALEAELAAEFEAAMRDDADDDDTAAGPSPAHSHQNGADSNDALSTERMDTGAAASTSAAAAPAASSSRRSFWGTPKSAPGTAPANGSTPATSPSAGAAARSSAPQGATPARATSAANTPASSATAAAGPAGGAGPSGKARVIKARCWMAQDFPMSLQQLLPLLDVIGTANKQLAKVGKFMHKYGADNMSLFPVKVNVPIIMTVYALVSFKHFKQLPPGGTGGLDPGFFDVPPGYRRKNLADVMDKYMGAPGGPGGRRPGARRRQGEEHERELEMLGGDQDGLIEM